ncbi:MAG: hypothetical protein VYE73_06385 [Acidobacteriota bacterium]|nr:hypothetical protein [Acidobacteriota bacterium]
MPIEMQAGALLECPIVLAEIPIQWRTHILEWDPPHRFVDTQEEGPCKTWLHTHSFQKLDRGVRMRDEVRTSLRRIFDHRFDVLARDLGSIGAGGETAPDGGYTAAEGRDSP